jgi:hypothetical protein
LNAWFSQTVENRTLKNLNMQLYDTTASETFQPQTFEPRAWGWYGVPGKPSEIYQQLPVADLSDTLEEMTYVTQMIEKATGATPTMQGQQTQTQVTLGEVQLALGEAKERVKGMSKFYTPAWKQRGEMFIKLLEAGADKIDAVTIYKKGRNTDTIYAREISPEDWKAKTGYRCRVWSQDEKQQADTQEITKLNAVKANMPMNSKLEEIFQRKLLEFADLTPDEINEVMAIEEQKRNAMNQMIDPLTGLPRNPITQAPETAGGQPEQFIQPPQAQPLANQ